MRALALVILGACTSGGGLPPRLPALDPLPAPTAVKTDRFTDAETCAQCHLGATADATTLHDAAGANVSPVLTWRASMMALAARDPFYLSVVAAQRAHAPGAATDALCLRCHAPAGAIESNDALGFDELVAGSSPAAVLGRGGVTCTLCHQIAAANLGDERTFSGGFDVGYGRQIFGRYTDPSPSPMMLIVDYTPTGGAHVLSSALCATCHTVIVPASATGAGEVVEQAAFLEWRSSSYAANQPCQSCHVPTTDDAGQPIATKIATWSGLTARTPFGRHTFVGGNSYVLRLLAGAVDWLGVPFGADELTASAARDDAHLATAATVTIADAHREGDTLVVAVRVDNRTGHKLPTGYPSRRTWLHLTASAGGAVAFESGGVDARGEIVGAAAITPHRDTITDPSQVQIWEAILVDDSGAPALLPLSARRYAKDDRILPMGFAPTGTDRTRTLPVGVDGDASFVPGADTVTYRIAHAPANATIAVELDYQALRPGTIDAIDDTRTPAGTRFVDLARATPITPVAIARATITVP